MKKFSVKDRLSSFKFAISGFRKLIKHEHNARVHLAITLLTITIGIIFHINIYEWSLIIFAIGIVFIAELLNTAIERLADFVEPEWNSKIGDIKDYAAAAVMTSALVAAAIGTIIFLPKIIQLF